MDNYKFPQPPFASLDSVFEKMIDDKVDLKLSILFNDEDFLKSLKEKLEINSTGTEFIDTATACKLLGIGRVTLFNRTKSGIYVKYKTTGSRKVLYKKSQLLATLKPVIKAYQ